MAEVIRIFRREDVDLDQLEAAREKYQEEERERLKLCESLGAPLTPAINVRVSPDKVYYETSKKIGNWIDSWAYSYFPWPSLRYSSDEILHKGVPREVLEETKLAAELGIFEKIYFRSERSKTALVVVVTGILSDKCYVIASFGNQKYVSELEELLSPKSATQADMMTVGDLCGVFLLVVFVLGIFVLIGIDLVREKTLYKNSVAHQPVAITQPPAAETVDMVETIPSPVAQTIDGYFIRNMLYYRDPKVVELPPDWKFCDNYSQNITLKQKFPTLKKGVLKVKSKWTDEKGNKVDWAVVLQVLLADGSIYEALPGIERPLPLRTAARVVIYSKDWRKVIGY